MLTNTHLLSKSTFVRGSQCKKSLYLNKYHRDLRDKIDDSTQAIFDSGHKVGDLAQGLFPGGEDTKFYEDFDVEKAVNKTKQLIESGVSIVYEAAFMFEECLTVIDILVNDGSGWKAYEVKSSGSVKEQQILDISYQYYIITKSGIELDDILIVYINTGYVRNGNIDLNQLFNIESLKDESIEKEEEIKKSIYEFKEVLKSSTIPTLQIGEYCTKPYKCDFHTNCWKDIPDNSIFDLIGMRRKKKFSLYESGIVKITEIPDEVELNVYQQMQLKSITNNEIHVDSDKISGFLKDLNYPLHFMDFETINPAIPMFDGTRPYMQIPFQYSLHKQSQIGEDPSHYEYLADGTNDPRVDFIRSLVDNIEGIGDIIVFNEPFERIRLKELADAFPEYKKDIEGIILRLKDLMRPFKERSFYHPELRGGYGLKVVLPALAPELSYDGLKISNGDAARISFLKQYDGSLGDEEKEMIRNDLLEYCKLDTFALVKILEELYKHAG